MNTAKITIVCLLLTVAFTASAQTKRTSMQDARKQALERAMKARKGESVDPTPVGSSEDHTTISIEDVHRAAAPDADEVLEQVATPIDAVVETNKIPKKEKKKWKKKKEKAKDISTEIVASETIDPTEEDQPYVITRRPPTQPKEERLETVEIE